MTTPPVSSSPAPAMDCMEMSPLPHKPVRYAYDVELQTPTPEATPVESTFPTCITPRPSSPIQVEEMQFQIPQERQERRRSNPMRPSLTRAKCYSTNCIPSRPNPESQLPSFKFGTGLPRSEPSSTLALSEIFEASSPVAERVVSPVPKPLLPASRIRQPPSLGVTKNASPLGAHFRKMSNPLVRPRKQFRRSLSMFEHPDEIMKCEKDIPTLPPIADMEVPAQPGLPHFYSDNSTCDLPRISRETMIQILDGQFDNVYEKRVVIDCRFEYEYQGGHIDGAVNYNDKDQLTAQLFDHEQPGKALLIFHCEYSAHRAPLMAKHIRNKDRTVNAESYPRLTYPEAYILDGGYSAFYKDHSNRCYPQNYVEMNAQEYADACEAGMGKVKQQQRAKLNRAQTFAYGQHSPPVDSSPTAMFRQRPDDTSMELDLDYTPIQTRPTFSALQIGRGQRMISF